jgi:Ni/Fe-hydrogenase subunit HybB-like protein
MFEVAFCVATYVLVMWIEFSPAFFEGRTEHAGKLKWINKLMFIFVALGVLLPTMHQSSLGTMMVIAGDKLSALWQTGLLPVLFLVTALTMGYAMVVFEAVFSALGFKRPQETPLLEKLSAVIPKLIVVYLVIRFGDLIWRGALVELLTFNIETVMFVVENLLYIYPMIILFSATNRANSKKLFGAAISMVLAGGLYRFNVYLIGFDPGNGYQYFPAFSEIMITVGIIAMEIMLYLIFVKKFPVLPEVKHA